MIEILWRNTPRVVVLLHVVGKAVHQDESAHSIRMVDGEMDDHPATFTPHHQYGSLETDRIEHGGEVGGEYLFDDGVARFTFGCAPAPRVEPDGAAEAGYTLAQANEPGFLRGEVDRYATQHEHCFEWSGAAHLVGQVGPVGRADVVGLGGVGDHLRQYARGAGILLSPSRRRAVGSVVAMGPQMRKRGLACGRPISSIGFRLPDGQHGQFERAASETRRSPGGSSMTTF